MGIFFNTTARSAFSSLGKSGPKISLPQKSLTCCQSVFHPISCRGEAFPTRRGLRRSGGARIGVSSVAGAALGKWLNGWAARAINLPSIRASPELQLQSGAASRSVEAPEASVQQLSLGGRISCLRTQGPGQPARVDQRGCVVKQNHLEIGHKYNLKL